MSDIINDLKRRHYNIKEVIKERVKKGSNCDDAVKKYFDIVQQLKENGVTVNDSSPALIQAINNYKGIVPTQTETPPAQPIQTTDVPVAENKIFEYRLVLAWTCKEGNEPTQNTLNIIEGYLEDNGAKKTGSDYSSFGGYSEHTLEYEWEGEEKEFKILRKSANYILDVFAENSYEKFNISVFGSKKS